MNGQDFTTSSPAQTPGTLLTGLRTRGDFRALSEHASQGSRLLPDSVTPEHPIWDVWNQIKSAYPGPCANWEVEPPMIWAYAIEGLKPEQLINGVKNLTRRDSAFPPSAGEFRDMCLTNYEWETRCHKILRTDNMIEDTTKKEQDRLWRIEQMKQLRAEQNI